ncbi:hypothetical protein C6496_15405 [Candidatus Poribacteria bacterium]|nr:MAG: hypothetical protein C6496_15405 [Candidatus Poribacteria bacterium]
MKLLLTQHKSMGNDVKRLRRIYIKDDRYKLRVLDIDNDFFESYIFEDNEPDDNEVETPSQRRLYEAKGLLDSWIKAHPDKVEGFIKKIGNMKILTYLVEDDSEAALIFETTNNRGKSLTSLEKVKSFLMHKTYLVSNSPGIAEDGLKRLQNRFSTIYRVYEEIEDSGKIRGEFGKTDEDSILQYHSIAFENWRNKEYQDSVRMINQRINSLIKANRTTDAAEFINKYSRELRESFKIMNKLLLRPDSYLLDIFALNRPAAFYPLLIKTYKRDQSNEKQNFEKVARLVEIICFRFGIIGARSDKGVSQLYGLARDFNGNFQRLIRELRSFIRLNCDDLTFRRALQSPSFYSDVNPIDQRYLFWKYENYLRETKGYSEMSYDEFTNTKPQSKFSMEHIIPQNPKESKIVVDDSILSTTDFESPEFKGNYLHSIGNLTIDPISANASKSNQNFPDKNQKYFCRAPLMAQNELIDFLNDETSQWDTVSISKRLEAIRLFALERWNHLKPGQKSSEIAEGIPSRLAEEEMWEDIWSSTEEPVE